MKAKGAEFLLMWGLTLGFGAAWGASVGTVAKYHDGRIDNIRVYRTALDSAMINNLYLYTQPTNCMVARL